MIKTQNNANAYRSTKNPIVDFFSIIGSSRQLSCEAILKQFKLSWAENKIITLRLLFYARDIRSGLGERRIFKICYKYLSKKYPEIALKNLSNISFFGRFDDMLPLLKTNLMPDVCKYLIGTLLNTNNSLVAKWMPSINASSMLTREYANIICKELSYTPKQYRNLIVEKRKNLNLIESKLTNKDYDSINYNSIPSIANKKYHKAFNRNDTIRYQEHIKNVLNGKENAKLNASILYPYEVVREVIRTPESDHNSNYLESTWRNIVDTINDKSINALAIIDTSFSMTNDKYLPISSAIALGIYFAEKNTGMFKNHFITFSRKPRLIEICGDNIYDKVHNILKYEEISNTDIEKTFDLLLSVILKYNIPKSDIPERLIIISDMQFDEGVEEDDLSLFDVIRLKWDKLNIKMPKLIYWNVSGELCPFPEQVNDNVQFVSGHSPNIFKSILQDEFLTPIQLIHSIVDSDRYSIINI